MSSAGSTGIEPNANEHNPWSAPQEIGPREPRYPYAHWWLEHGRAACGATPKFLVLNGSDLLNPELKLTEAERGAHGRWQARGAPPEGVDAVLEDHRLTPVRVPGTLLNPDCREAARLYADNAHLGEDAVILGIIDDGIGFANERFRRYLDDGTIATRFDHLWLQGVPDNCGCEVLRGQSMGRELTAAEIDGLLAKHQVRRRDGSRAPVVDEEALYRDVGLIDFSGGEVQSAAVAASHGTGVLDRAAGCDMRHASSGFARNVAIIGVSLPSQITRDTSGTFLDLFVLLGLRRILRRAEYLRGQGKYGEVPVVINISIALTAGPKDGSGLIERYIAGEIERANRIRPGLVQVVMPSGNHRLWRTHATFDRNAMVDSPRLTWRVLPDDRTPSFVEIWTRRQNARPDAPTVTLALRPPGAWRVHPPQQPGFGSFVDFDSGGARAARAYYSWHPADPAIAAGPGRQRIVLVVPPSVGQQPCDLRGAPGDWVLRLDRAPDAEPLAVDLHIQRDDALPGFHGGGRQSYFPDPDYREYGDDGRLVEDPEGERGPVTRKDTINALCAGEGPLAVSGFRAQGRRLVPYSGLGPDDDGKPDAVAVSETSGVQRGVLTAGTFSGSTVPIAGTSIAAPRVARYLLERDLERISGQETFSEPPPPIRGIPVMDSQGWEDLRRLGNGDADPATPDGWKRPVWR